MVQKHPNTHSTPFGYKRQNAPTGVTNEKVDTGLASDCPGPLTLPVFVFYVKRGPALSSPIEKDLFPNFSETTTLTVTKAPISKQFSRLESCRILRGFSIRPRCQKNAIEKCVYLT